MSLNPWRILRGCWPLTFETAPLPPGEQARLYHDGGVILMTPGLSQVERRCAVAHELAHYVRGDRSAVGPYGAGDDRAADDMSARWLIDIHQLGEALCWSHDLAEVADELSVDERTLRARLQHLHPAERGYLRRRLDMREHTA